MLLLKEKKAGGWGPGAQGGLPFRQKIEGEDGRKIEQHDWGMIWRGEADDDISSFESRSPQPTWAPYLEHHLRVIAPAFDLPYEYLLMVFSAGSYTAQRSASMHARHTFLREHYRICNQFMKRLWNWRVAKAMKEKELPAAPVDSRSGMSEWYWVKFSKPDYGWLNPGEHAKGVKEMWNLGLTSLDGIIDGDEDRDEVFKSKVEDIESAQRLAEEFNSANPNAEPLGWRDVISSMSPGQPAGGTRIIGENRGEDTEE
jgi:capsid protein